jgi:hypothetical protein
MPPAWLTRGLSGEPGGGADGCLRRRGDDPRAEHDQTSARLERMKRQKLTNLPLTTSDGRLVGLLTLRDAEEARLGRSD